MSENSDAVSLKDTTSPTDFFVAGGTLRPDSPSYVKRAADDELFNLALAGEFCYVLTARQMGKSSLMIRTASRLKKEADVKSIIIDLTKIGTDVSVEQWYLGVLTQLKRRLRLSVDPAQWWAEQGDLGYVQRFTDYLHDVLLTEIESQVVIFMDEIDTTLNLSFSDDFFAAIRYVFNARANNPKYGRLTFVLLGVATPADLIKDRSRTPFNIGQGVYLGDFSTIDSWVLRRGLKELYGDDGETVYQHIFAWTGGHPYLTQKLCLSACESGRDIRTKEDVDQLVETLFLSKEARKETNLQFVRDSIESSPQSRQLLKLYQRIYKGGQVSVDERSAVQNELKLFGLVRIDNNTLQVRNEIYRRVFNETWIKAMMPVDWSKRMVTALLIVVIALLGVIFYYNFQNPVLPTSQRAQIYSDQFRSAFNANEQVVNLAGLFGLVDVDIDYQSQAEMLFYDHLTPEERLAMFSTFNLDEATEATRGAFVDVTWGLYRNLENNDRDNALLEAMVKPLNEIDGARARVLTIEINQWRQGRRYYNEGALNEALGVYNLILDQTDHNPGIYLDRALAQLALGNTQDALSDFEQVLNLEPSRHERITKIIRRNKDLSITLFADSQSYPQLLAFVPSPTPTVTPTPTPTPTPTATTTPTETPSPTITPTPTSTPRPTVTPTPTSTPTSTQNTPLLPTVTPTILPSPTNTATPTPKPAEVVFVQTHNEIHQLGLVGSDGIELDVNLQQFAAAPAWSPDGRKLAFFGETGISQLGGVYQEGNGLWVIDLDKSLVEQRIKTDHVKNLQWSPDGQKFAFEVAAPSLNPEVIVADAQTGQYLARFVGQQPAWAPDGQTLAVKTCSPDCGLWRLHFDGTSRRRITNVGSDSFPVWSPDGQYLAFASHSRTGDWELFRLSLADNNIEQLTNQSGTDITPYFSADSRELYYRTDAFGQWQIRAIAIDGSNNRLIRDHVGHSQDWGLARPAIK